MTEKYLGDAVYASFDGYHVVLRCAAPPCVICLEPAVYQNLTEYVSNLRKQQEKIMSEQNEAAATEQHDNSWLRPYLKLLAEGGEEGIPKAAAEAAFLAHFESLESGGEYIGGSKIRQTMYIAGLAKSSGNMIFLTPKGWEFING